MNIKQQFRIAGPWLSLVVTLLALCLPGRVAAQLDRGEITGTVEDASGAVVPKATVLVHNGATNADTTLTTDDKGYFSAPLLQPGNYKVTVTASGFSTFSF